MNIQSLVPAISDQLTIIVLGIKKENSRQVRFGCVFLFSTAQLLIDDFKK